MVTGERPVVKPPLADGMRQAAKRPLADVPPQAVQRLLASEAHSFISSQLVKEVASLGGNVAGLVPPAVEERMKRRALGHA